jgi:colanic acid biosynthesis glycosyl transferase WcaI
VRVALYNQFFWPDQAATSQLLTDLVRELSAAGHEVTVVCAAAGYAGDGSEPPPAATVRRAPSLPFSRGTVARLGSYLSYLGAAAWHTIAMPRVDVVVTMTTPPMLSLLGNVARTFRGARHVVWEMDLYPEVAVDLGVIARHSWLDKVLSAIAHRSRNHADAVWVLGECMRQRVLAAGVAPERIQVFENWSDPELFQHPVAPAAGRLELLYSGNLGLTHDIDTVREAMVALQDDSGIRLRIAGGGPRRAALDAFVKSRPLTNVEFLPYCAKRELGGVLSAADVGLVTLRTECAGAVVPSKVYGLMACGRPVLFVGPAGSTAARVIERFDCGWRIDCGDARGLAALLRMLAARPDLIRSAGERARSAFLQHYNRHDSVARLTRALELGASAAAFDSERSHTAA